MPRYNVARPSHPSRLEMEMACPYSKKTSRRIQDIRPIMLMEVLRKLWTGLLVDEVTSSPSSDTQRSLCLNMDIFLITVLIQLTFSYSTRSNPHGRNASHSMVAHGT